MGRSFAVFYCILQCFVKSLTLSDHSCLGLCKLVDFKLKIKTGKWLSSQISMLVSDFSPYKTDSGIVPYAKKYVFS